jgi:hypothetical protein
MRDRGFPKHFDGRRFYNPDAPQARGFLDALRWKLSSRPEPSPEFISDVEQSTPPRYLESNELRITLVVASLGTAEDPRAYGEKVAHRFCPNILPYEVGTLSWFGFLEWNGRSLTDNAPDAMFSLASNSPVRLGIGKDSITSNRRKYFRTFL